MNEPDSETQHHSIWNVLVGLAISAVFLYVTFRQVDLQRIGAEMQNVHLAILGLSLVTQLGEFGALTVRSHLLFDRLGSFRFGSLFRSILVAFVGNNLFPMRAGEFMRVGYLQRIDQESTPEGCLSAIALERLADMAVLSVAFVVCVTITAVDLSVRGLPPLYLAGAITGACTLLVGGMFLIGGRPDTCIAIAETLTRPFGETISTFVVDRVTHLVESFGALASIEHLAGVVAATLGYWGAACGSIAIWIAAFDLSVPWYAPVVVTIFTAFGVAIPSSPGYVGTYHYFAKLSLQLFGVSASLATSFAIVGHAMAIVPFTVIGIAIVAPEIFGRGREPS
jgi:uncharacterized membrane protein YbhN (UPF0104 family)